MDDDIDIYDIYVYMTCMIGVGGGVVLVVLTVLTRTGDGLQDRWPSISWQVHSMRLRRTKSTKS